jgi:hypothetical protein
MKQVALSMPPPPNATSGLVLRCMHLYQSVACIYITQWPHQCWQQSILNFLQHSALFFLLHHSQTTLFFNSKYLQKICTHSRSASPSSSGPLLCASGSNIFIACSLASLSLHKKLLGVIGSC